MNPNTNGHKILHHAICGRLVGRIDVFLLGATMP